MLCQLQVYSKVIQLYTYIYIYSFEILFPYRLLQNIEYSPLGKIFKCQTQLTNTDTV